MTNSFARTAQQLLALMLIAGSGASAQTVLITGANSGIGLEFTKQYAEKGWTVIATHRRDETPETLREVMQEHPNVRAERMDVTSRAEIYALAEKLKDAPIMVAEAFVAHVKASENLGLRWTHLPEVQNATFATNPATTVQPTKSYDRFDLVGSWSIRDNMQLRFGIDNLLDADPEIVGYNPGQTNAMGSTSPGFYDILGRRYYAGVKFSF